MGFSSALQGRAAHEALLLRQDAEIRLMDAMKRCLAQKAKCDKDYAIALTSVAQQGLKIDRADDLQGSLVTKAWRATMEEYEQTAKQLRMNAELLDGLCQDKLSQLYQDKRKARKAYQEEHSKIASQFNQLTEEVARKKTEYQKHLEYYKLLRTRFEEHYIKSGRAGRKLDEVRDKYQKACRKLHLAHNEYVLLVTEVVEVEKDFRTVLLPGLLEHQQSLQEGFIQTWRNILLEAADFTDFTSDKFKEIQKRIESGISNVNPSEEYREFTEKHKTSPTVPIVFQFDETLIEDTLGKLQPNTLTVDNLTVDSLRSRLQELETSIREAQEKQTKLATESGTATPILHAAATTNGTNGNGVTKDLIKYSKDLNALRCQEQRSTKLADMIKNALNELGCEELPSGCDDLSVDQSFIENNVNAEQTGTPSAYILQKGAEMISMFRAPFKRKSVPLGPTPTTTTPERTPRSKRSASASRSLTSLGSSSVNSLASQKCVQVSDTNPDNNELLDVGCALTNDNRSERDSLQNTVEVDDNDAFPDELINNSKNNLLTISSTEEHNLKLEEKEEFKEDELSDKEFTSDIDSKSPDQENKISMKVRLKKKIRNQIKEFGQQFKDSQQNLENTAEMSNKMRKYFNKVNSNENDKLLSDDASSSKVNSPVHLSPIIVPEDGGTKRKFRPKSKKKKFIEVGTSSDDNLLVDRLVDKTSKSFKTSIFSSFRNYTKSNTEEGEARQKSEHSETLEDSFKMMDLDSVGEEAVESKSEVKSGKSKTNLKSKFKFKLKRDGDGKKGKTCKTCSKRFRKIHPSHTVLDFKKEFGTDAMFESEFCICNNSFSIKNLNGTEADFMDDEDDLVNIKNHLYSEIDCMTLSTNRPLYEEEWFHGVLPREEVVRLLKNEGDFLVRETIRNEESQIVLSVCWNGHKHFIVQTTTDSHYRFEGPAFPSIQELIMHQYHSESAVTGRSGAVLRKPVLRERWELSNDDVLLIDKIGRGNFGDVYKAKLKPSKKDVAVKTCRMTLPDEQKRKFLQEGRILKQYDHPNIVKLIGICVQKQPIMIVMELVPGGSLLNFLRKQKVSLNSKQLIGMCRDAAAGMRYLESKNCIHRDLAARNCLIGYENIVKISDFGMSREEEEYIVSDGMKQIPIKWTAPEALNFGKYTSLCDVWSYGILMWEIFSKGDTPYSGMSNARAREHIDTGYRMPAPDNTPPEMYRLMLKCWSYEPENRPHFEEIFTVVEAIANRD